MKDILSLKKKNHTSLPSFWAAFLSIFSISDTLDLKININTFHIITIELI